MSTLHAALERLRADIDMILESRVLEFESPAEDKIMAALFATSEIPPPPPRENTKRHKCREEDEARQRKKQRRDMEAARRALLADEEAHRIRAVESDARASISRDVEIAGDTADSVFADAETTEGFHTTMVVGTMGE